MKKYLLALLLLLLQLNCALAIESDTVFSRFFYGVYSGLSLNYHHGNFYKLPGVPNCCVSFNDATGNGPDFGVQLGTSFYKNFRLGAKIGVQSLNGEFVSAEPTYVMVDDGSIRGEFKHHLNAKLLAIGLEPRVGYNIFKGLFIDLGAKFSFFGKSDFEQYEQISKPEIGANFADSNGNNTYSKFRNQFSGKISEMNPLQIFGTIALSYELPMNKDNSMTLSPEIEYSQGFTNIIKNYDWKVNTLYCGLAIKYYPPKAKEPVRIYRKEEKIDTVKVIKELIARDETKNGFATVHNDTLALKDSIIYIERYLRTDTLYLAKNFRLEANISACGVDSNGSEIPSPLFVVEEIYTTKYHPTLNYVFFDENSAEIPNRFNLLNAEQAKKYSIDSLKGIATLPVYYDALNIIGRRLNDNKQIKLNIIGYNSGVGEEKDNKALSKGRAESIANYFINVWGIDQKRLKITAKNLPDKASTPIDEPEKAEENRRVEIVSISPELDEPTSSSDIVRKVSPPTARFKPTATSEAGLKSGLIQIGQNGAILKEFNFNDKALAYYDWKLDEDQKTTPKIDLPLEYKLTLSDIKGQKIATDAKTMNIEQITIKKKRIEKISDYEVEKYSLILFDFDSDRLNETAIKTIKSVKEKIKENAKVKITGYTDKTGESEHNKDLSFRRAEAVYKLLGVKSAEYFGVGSEKALFDNNTPEGRIFSRTVEISIDTPVEYK